MKSVLTLLVAAAVLATNSFAFPALHLAPLTAVISGAAASEDETGPPAALLGTIPLVINEIDYDQVSGDTAEFIELRNNGAGPVNLDNYTVDLVNGATPGGVYDTIDLPNVNLAAGDYFVICGNAATVPNCDLDDGPNTDFIQNGAPDAVGLRLSGTLVDAVSYEGDTAAPYTEGSGVPVASADSNTVAFIGLSQFPDGVDTNNNSADLSLRCITPGEANSSASTGCTAPGGLPNLTINDVTAAETNAGTTTFTFSVTLSSAALAGGVTFDIATADGTAQDDNPSTEDNDYVAQSLTGQTIPAGTTGPYSFNVTVNGDTTTESSETFFVNVTNVVGAIVADGQGLGTIVNDDGSTAADVSLSGRVRTAAGRGIGGARLTLVSGDGVVVTTLTSAFGYYSFEGVTAGQAYTISVHSKRYQFSEPVRLVNLDDAISGLDFVAN